MLWSTLVPGVFCKRDNRFRATVEVDGIETWAHVPNSGRLGELFLPERPVWLVPAARPGRITDYDLVLVAHERTLVSVDARLPNTLLTEAIANDSLFGDYQTIEREITHGHSRLDLRLTGMNGPLWIETKSVTLVEGDTALFPDAPTSRGRRHLDELASIATAGDKTAIVFVVQRADAEQLRPYHENDEAFAISLSNAHRAGVEVRAYTCQVTLDGICIARPIPVHLYRKDE